MVLLDAECEEYVYMWKCMCEEAGVPHAEFVEPDIGDQMTAIALLPNEKLVGKLRSMKLLDFRPRDVSSAPKENAHANRNDPARVARLDAIVQ